MWTAWSSHRLWSLDSSFLCAVCVTVRKRVLACKWQMCPCRLAVIGLTLCNFKPRGCCLLCFHEERKNSEAALSVCWPLLELYVLSTPPEPQSVVTTGDYQDLFSKKNVSVIYHYRNIPVEILYIISFFHLTILYSLFQNTLLFFPLFDSLLKALSSTHPCMSQLSWGAFWDNQSHVYLLFQTIFQSLCVFNKEQPSIFFFFFYCKLI